MRRGIARIVPLEKAGITTIPGRCSEMGFVLGPNIMKFGEGSFARLEWFNETQVFTP
jgi:hypothetical protein